MRTHSYTVIWGGATIKCVKNAILGSTITCVKKRPKRCVKKCPKSGVSFFIVILQGEKIHTAFSHAFSGTFHTRSKHTFSHHSFHTTFFKHTFFTPLFHTTHFSHHVAIHGFLWLPMSALLYVSSWPAIRYAPRFGATRDY